MDQREIDWIKYGIDPYEEEKAPGKSLEEYAREQAWQIQEFRDTVRERIRYLRDKALKAKAAGELEEATSIAEQALLLEASWKIYSPEPL